MDYTLTQHARDAMDKRNIPVEWMERVLAMPQVSEPDAVDPDLEHRLAAIPEHGNRILRVIVNTKIIPERVVTMYFDRNMRGKL